MQINEETQKKMSLKGLKVAKISQKLHVIGIRDIFGHFVGKNGKLVR